MKKALLFIILLFSTLSYSQSIKLEGIVTDTKATSLEMANVMAVNQATKAMDAYAISTSSHLSENAPQHKQSTLWRARLRKAPSITPHADEVEMKTGRAVPKISWSPG